MSVKKILGAGPSGLTAAINLAKAGYDVDVYETRPDTGKRFHGDVQGLENWSNPANVIDELAAMNIEVNFDCDPLRHLILTNGTKQRTSHYPDDRPLCYLVKRGTLSGSLDQGLKAQALAAGVNIYFGQTLPEYEADIVATGPISKEQFAVDKGIVFETNHEDVNVFLLNDEAAYKGYSYLLITNGYGCLCTVLFDRFSQLNACYEASERIFKEMLPFDVINPQPVAGIGCFSTKNRFRQGDTLYVGEAAGIQDFLWGFGIRTAVQSGYLAADCLINGRDYAAVAKAFFEPKLKATLISRFFWELARFRDYAIVVDAKTNRTALKSLDLSLLYNFGSLHKLLYPIARWTMRRRYPNLKL
jgi:flavin-dependent dehydrogenase